VEYAYQILARHNVNAWTIGTIVEVD